MCLIIASRVGNLPSAGDLVRGFEANPDCWGVMSAQDGLLYIDKGYDMADMLDAVQKVCAVGYPYVIHFRYATHGSVSEANCHPVEVLAEFETDANGAEGGLPEVWMAHNGILPVATVGDESDTVAFSHILRAAILSDPEWFLAGETLPTGSKEFQFITDVGEWIGKHNKLALLTSDGDLMLVNEDTGFWKDSIWYSNNSAEFKHYTPWDSRRAEWDGTKNTDEYAGPFDDSDAPEFATSNPYESDPYEWHYENESAGYAKYIRADETLKGIK